VKRPIDAPSLTGLQLAVFLGLLAGVVGIPWLAIERADWAIVVRHRPDAFWITTPQPKARTRAIPLDRANPVPYRFERTIRLAAVPERADLHVRALRDWGLEVNGVAVEPEGARAGSWKRATRVDLAERLVAGENRVAVEVRNPTGPPLLQTWSAALPEALGTGRGWSVSVAAANDDGPRVAAEVAHDVRRYPPGASLPTPADALRARGPALALVFVLFAAPALAPARWPRAGAGRNAPRAAFAAVSLVWLVLFVRKALELPLVLGFDAEAHLEYVRFLATEGRVPRPDEGWEMFQPPLYHAAAAGLRALVGAESGTPLERAALRILPGLAGLAGAWLAGRTALRLWPDRPARAALAVGAAGLLPMNLYMSTFASNESVHAGLVGAALCIACALLVTTRAPTGGLAALSATLGLALATKPSSLPVAGVLVATVGAKLWAVEGRTLGRALAATGALVVGPAVLAGWFYARNWWLFGDPVVTNLDALGDLTYWMPPGFHTPPWFLGFGEALSRPFFASFHSYADGFYASFWGDGYASGRSGVQYPNPWWDYGTMLAIYPLALPATAIGALGLGRCAIESLRGPDAGRRLALTAIVVILVGMLLALLLATLRIPQNAMPKAFYTRPALVPFALAFAAGAGWLWERAPAPAARAHGRHRGGKPALRLVGARALPRAGRLGRRARAPGRAAAPPRREDAAPAARPGRGGVRRPRPQGALEQGPGGAAARMRRGGDVLARGRDRAARRGGPRRAAARRAGADGRRAQPARAGAGDRPAGGDRGDAAEPAHGGDDVGLQPAVRDVRPRPGRHPASEARARAPARRARPRARERPGAGRRAGSAIRACGST